MYSMVQSEGDSAALKFNVADKSGRIWILVWNLGISYFLQSVQIRGITSEVHINTMKNMYLYVDSSVYQVLSTVGGACQML